MDVVRQVEGFEWDEGNETKNWTKHRVSRSECEEIFFNRPLVVAEDSQHSQEENRFLALGHTDRGRRLFLVYALRHDRIRVISARDMTPREKRVYEAEMVNEYEENP